MKKLLLIILIILSLIIVSCNFKIIQDEKDNNDSNTQIANPASVHCEELGGTLDIRDYDEGQIGICIKDDSECEEWALYRGECNFDEKRVYCTQAQKNAVFCTREYMPVFGYKQVQCIKAPCPPIRDSYSNKCGACSSGVDYYINQKMKLT